jgi:hypothetical protein
VTVKKNFFLVVAAVLCANVLFAQDDELPPPSSKPKPESQQPAQSAPDNGSDFKGFSKSKKIDLSKFIIEPDFYFDIAGPQIDLGFSPYVGYKVWKELYLGGGVTYLYTGFHNLQLIDPASGATYNVNANWHTFGGGVFAQYNIWKGFFARTRFEVLHRIMDDIENPYLSVQVNSNGSYSVYIPKVQKTIPAEFVGVGYNLLRSKNFFFPIMVSYNLLYSVTDKTYSVYPHGWVVQLGFVNIF